MNILNPFTKDMNCLIITSTITENFATDAESYNKCYYSHAYGEI